MHHGSSCFPPMGSWKWWLWRIFEVWHSGGSDLEARHPCGSVFLVNPELPVPGIEGSKHTSIYFKAVSNFKNFHLALRHRGCVTAFFVDQNLFVGSCWIQYSQQLKARCFIQLHPQRSHGSHPVPEPSPGTGRRRRIKLGAWLSTDQHNGEVWQI